MADVHVLGDYLNQAELAKQLGKSQRTLQRWRNERKGPVPTVLGKEPLYHLDDVKTWLHAQRQVPKQSKRRRK